ncbi:hypothetical protein COLO4_09659 [Corchorus olitorius]|uniref:Uncharacterized protein n=1 Tax=Corchorus olitorius TaxID=93759 RepID=A0A1R3KBF1_9ROSI|nr:hypothetical protein COLO4_09659 [Corchorus olitorius]
MSFKSDKDAALHERVDYLITLISGGLQRDVVD